jgi:hypothetical protein
MEKTVKVVNNISLPINGWIRLAINITAAMVSWFFTKSFWWTVFHFLFGIWYLIYMLITGEFVDGAFMEIMKSYF